MAHDDPHRFADIHHELHRHLPSEPALRVKALESLLIDKGMLDPRAVDAWIAVYTEEIGPKRGATLVAKAWLDPAFRQRLLADGTRAISELGFEGWAGAHFKVVENTPAIHNMIVCTLCSCYPHSVLGVPPNWYKSAAYRARAVREPRAVLPSSARPCRRRWRSGSGTAPPSCATWFCPSGQPVPRAGARMRWRASSPAMP